MCQRPNGRNSPQSTAALNSFAGMRADPRNDKGPDCRLSLCGGLLTKTSWATPETNTTEVHRGLPILLPANLIAITRSEESRNEPQFGPDRPDLPIRPGYYPV